MGWERLGDVTLAVLFVVGSIMAVRLLLQRLSSVSLGEAKRHIHVPGVQARRDAHTGAPGRSGWPTPPARFRGTGGHAVARLRSRGRGGRDRPGGRTRGRESPREGALPPRIGGGLPALSGLRPAPPHGGSGPTGIGSRDRAARVDRNGGGLVGSGHAGSADRSSPSRLPFC